MYKPFDFGGANVPRRVIKGMRGGGSESTGFALAAEPRFPLTM